MSHHRASQSSPAVLAAFAIALATSPARSMTFEVTSSRDASDAVPGDATCADHEGACTLRAAIQEANALQGADEIRLPAGRFALELPGQDEDLARTGDLDLLDDVAIVGAGAMLTRVDAARIDRAFDVPCSSHAIHVALRDLAVENGSRSCVRVLGPSALEVSDALVAGGTSATAGGNLYLRGAQADLRRSIIRDGEAAWQGGGVAIHGGRIDLVDCDVSGNRSPHGAGLFAGHRATVTLAGERPTDAILIADPPEALAMVAQRPPEI